MKNFSKKVLVASLSALALFGFSQSDHDVWSFGPESAHADYKPGDPPPIPPGADPEGSC